MTREPPTTRYVVVLVDCDKANLDITRLRAPGLEAAKTARQEGTT